MTLTTPVGQQHHGAVCGKSTQTLVSELQDILAEDISHNREAVLIALDQSKAYDLVSHEILLGKMRILGFKQQALKIMSSFLSNRKQYIQVEGKKSQKLLIGPNSVIQGSTLSCVLYLIYILDLPELFHTEKHEPAEYRNCHNTNLKTFIDDAYLKTIKKQGKTLKETVVETMNTIEEYTRANKLALNPDKSKIMLFTKDNVYKENFSIDLKGKTKKHSTEMLILGNLMADSWTWDKHIKQVLIPALSNKIRTLRLVNKYLDPGYKAICSPIHPSARL